MPIRTIVARTLIRSDPTTEALLGLQATWQGSAGPMINTGEMVRMARMARLVLAALVVSEEPPERMASRTGLEDRLLAASL